MKSPFFIHDTPVYGTTALLVAAVTLASILQSAFLLFQASLMLTHLTHLPTAFVAVVLSFLIFNFQYNSSDGTVKSVVPLSPKTRAVIEHGLAFSTIAYLLLTATSNNLLTTFAYVTLFLTIPILTIKETKQLFSQN